MKKSIDVLNALYRNADMGSSAIENILPKVKNPRLKSELKAQLDTYQAECASLSEEIRKLEQIPKPAGVVEKAVADGGILVSSLMNPSEKNLAKIMVEGTNMGVIEIQQVLNGAAGISSSLRRTAESMMKKEQQYIDRLKPYL